MLKKLSVKTKIIIFIAASIVVVFIMIKTGIYNRKHAENAEQNGKSTGIIVSNQKNSEIKQNENKEDDVKQNENKEGSEEDNKKQSGVDTEFDESYKKAYESFHGKKYADAVMICDDIIKKDAGYYKAYNIRGIALCYSGKYGEGMSNIDKSLQINPDFGYARFNKALAYELYGYYDEAIKWYNKDLEIEKYIWSYYGLASIYGRKGDVSSTVRYLKTAIDMDKSVKDVAKDEKDFDNVRNSTEFQNLIK